MFIDFDSSNEMEIDAVEGRSTRLLILVPIIHTRTDFGSLEDSVRRRYIERNGAEQWDRRQDAVTDLWSAIRTQIEALDLDFSRVRLYQDGLPRCGQEEAIVRSLAREGSVNHMLLLDLMVKGAKLMGTEAAELLVKEYEVARDALAAGSSSRNLDVSVKYGRISKRLLEERDAYIARQIDQTLLEGETGLIFLGMLHALERHLASDIRHVRLGDVSQGQDSQHAGPPEEARPPTTLTG